MSTSDNNYSPRTPYGTYSAPCPTTTEPSEEPTPTDPPSGDPPCDIPSDVETKAVENGAVETKTAKNEAAENEASALADNIKTVESFDHKENEKSEISTSAAPPPADDPTKRPVFVFKYKLSEDWDEAPPSHINAEINKVLNSQALSIGTVGVPYECIIDFSSIQNKLTIVACHPFQFSCDTLGLNVELAQKGMRIFGSPLLPFEEKIEFWYIEASKSDQIKEGKIVSGKDEYLHNRFQKELIINADPKSLWLDLPVEDYEGYKNDDNTHDGIEFDIVTAAEKKRLFTSTPAETGKIEILMASRRGRSHAHVGKPRDDCFYWEIDDETGWNFVAVADGAGSAKYSRKGSEIACQTVVKQLRRQITAEYDAGLCISSDAVNKFARKKKEFLKSGGKWDPTTWDQYGRAEFLEETKLDGIFHIAVDAAIRAIHEEAKTREGATPKDYHTTLLCAAFKHFGPINPDPSEISGWLIASYWVGDGGGAILRWDGLERALVLGEPDGGEYAGQTRFLTIPDEIQPDIIKKRLRFSFCDSFGALLLVTDGITDPFFPSEAAVADEHRWLEFYEQKLKKGCPEEPNGCPAVFDPNKSPTEKSAALLEWLNFWSKGNHDDRTILIVKPK